MLDPLFEYQYETAETPEQIVNIANEVSQKGWELVSVTSVLKPKWVNGINDIHTTSEIVFNAFFKRPKKGLRTT